MQISKRQLDAKLERSIKDGLAQVVTDLSSKEKAAVFLEDFLTETEYMALAKRLAIMTFLTKGKSYEEIKQDIKVSSATIATVQTMLDKKNPGIESALRYLRADEWASMWTDKLTGMFGKK